MSFEPVVKWSGSKRSQAKTIINYFPRVIDTYYEPFCGGCSVLYALLQSDIKVNKYICSDLNSDLINLFIEIKAHPDNGITAYSNHWNKLTSYDNIDEKRQYFEFVRDEYNKHKNPLDFMFIMRTTTNGMPRYNKFGEFNNSFHLTRNGIKPNNFKPIIYEWSGLLNKFSVEFICQSYENIKPNIDDFMYLDPPYAHTKGMYFGNINYISFWYYLRDINCGYALSFDGISGVDDNTYDVPEDLFDKHIYLCSGNSSFKRVIGKNTHSIVYESLYLKNNFMIPQITSKLL